MSPNATDPRSAERPGGAGSAAAVPARRPTLVAFAGAILALAVLYRDTFLSMAEKWSRSETYAHGFLILPISAFLVWRRRREVSVLVPAPNPRALAMLAALSFLWLMGWATNVLVVEQLAVVLMIPALVVAVAGMDVARALMFPLGYLLFAVPIGDEVVPALTEFTARFTLQAIQIIGVPIVRDGYYLHIPGQTWEVTKACSGVRYLIASLAIGCIFAYLQFRTLRYRLGFIGLAVVVPIAANGARAFGIVMLGYLTYGRLATGVDHIIYGWFFFALVMMLLLWFGTRLREPVGPEAPAPAPAPARRPGGGAARATALTAAIAVVLPGLTLFSAHRFDRSLDARMAGLDARAPAGGEGWIGPEETDDDWSPRFENPAKEIRKVYRKGPDRVQLFAAIYGRQRQGAELISAMNRIYELKTGWRRADERERDVVLDGRPFRVIETDLIHSTPGGGERHRLAWQWYVVAGTPTTNVYVAKLLEVRALLSRRRGPSIAIAIAADYDARRTTASRVLGTFLKANEPALRRTVEGEAEVASPGRAEGLWPRQGTRTIRSRTFVPPTVPIAS